MARSVRFLGRAEVQRVLVVVLVAGSLAPVACGDLIGAENIHVDEPSDAAASLDSGDSACTSAADCPALTDSPAGCSEPGCEVGKCVYVTRDTDGDGSRSAASCSATGALVRAGDDCDDADPGISPTRRRPCSAKEDAAPIVFPGGRPQGVCRFGEQACDGNRVGRCEGAVGPSAEACDGAKDESCDGAVDEGCACVAPASRPCGIQVGACKGGVQTCVAGNWGTCVGGSTPQPLACDGLDHDCDGKRDTEQEAKTEALDVGNACLHLFFCKVAGRAEVCARSGIGYTYYCDGTTRRTLGYAPIYSLSGSPSPAPPAGHYRIANNATATKVGPFDAPSACCGAGGCQAPAQPNSGVYLALGVSGSQLYTASP